MEEWQHRVSPTPETPETCTAGHPGRAGGVAGGPSSAAGHTSQASEPAQNPLQMPSLLLREKSPKEWP